MEMKNAYIMSVVRTAVGEYGDSLRSVPAHTMGTLVIQGTIRRAGVNKEWTDEVILGEVRQNIEASNIARYTALEAGLPGNVPGFTANRLCAFTMQALFSGCQEIWCGETDVIVAGGTESMGRAPHYLHHERWGDDPLTLVDSNIEADTIAQPVSIHDTALSMPKTAENVAKRSHITREEQDRPAVEGQRWTAATIVTNYLKEEILPMEVKKKKKNFVFDTDKFSRPNTTVEILTALGPTARPDGIVTADNSRGLNNNASTPVLMSERKMKESRLKPLTQIVGITRAALNPVIMGYGPVYATRKIMKRTGVTVEQMDLVELNEVSTSRAVVCMQDLGLDPEKININGGAIALGHPLGSTGTRLIVTLLHNLMCIGGQYGLATLRVSGGRSMATMIEKL